MTPSMDQAVLTAANDTPGADRVTVALHGLTLLLARAHVREIAGRATANLESAPALAPRGGGW